MAVEWHLVWAAGSGMEILLASALALSVFSLPIERPLILGGLVGLAVFTRPDGLALLPFALARLWLGGQGRVRRSLQCAAGFGLMAAPYLLLNYWLAGDLWPNTLYAKQAEYAVQREMPLLLRLWQVGAQPWIGATALLLPGVAFAVWGAARRRAWTVLLPLGWALAHIGAYALRLPVIYQYGRYVMPTIPVWIVIGTGGAAALLHLLALARPGGAGGRAAPALPRILSRTWLASLGLLALVFWGIGAGVYRRDVRIIETEMVATAKWVAAHTPPEALVAAHDIGALGYFGERRLLDLAGLVSPEVIPFIRDEARLGAWLDQAGADYLVTFPGWYAELDRGLPAVYQTTAPFAPQAGGENMAVYAWPAPPP